MDEPNLDRRRFLRQGLRDLARAVVESFEETAPPPQRRLRPPGARIEAEFLDRCTRCDDCVRVCPAQCLVKAPEGDPDAGTPFLLPSLRACVLCTDLACTHVCEPGALEPLQRPQDVAIGLAWLQRSSCLPFQGEACTICHEVCPTEPKAIDLEGGRPRVRADLCTGCGLCEERCPTRPRSIQVLPLAPRPADSGLDSGSGGRQSPEPPAPRGGDQNG
ncbi:MAG TPA: 4Fe-4S dicluster domain-containing protein [Planctomycetota bacterium]